MIDHWINPSLSLSNPNFSLSAQCNISSKCTNAMLHQSQRAIGNEETSICSKTNMASSWDGVGGKVRIFGALGVVTDTAQNMREVH